MVSVPEVDYVVEHRVFVDVVPVCVVCLRAVVGQHWDEVAELSADCLEVRSLEVGLVLEVHIVAVEEVGNCFADLEVAEREHETEADLHEREVC